MSVRPASAAVVSDRAEGPASRDPAPERRLRALLLAYSCAPDRGSEPGVGWNRAIETARRFDTWVLCNEDASAEPVQRWLDAHGPVPGLHVIFVPRRRLERRIGKVPGLYYVAYNLWHRRAYRTARRLHETHRFDIVHQVTFCGYREPGYVWKLGAPFVWGPIGGTQNYPWRFLLEAGPLGLLSEASRTVFNILQLRLSARVRAAARSAAVVFAANSTNQADLRRAHGVEAPLLLETGVRHVGEWPPVVEPHQALRLLWSGGLAPHKGLSLLLKALGALPKDAAFELRVYGEGPCRRRWQRLAERLGIDRHVTWMGQVPYREALASYQWADVFVFTSLRDTSGNVVLEALAAGVPVVCLDHQGAGDIVTPECGIAVPVTTPQAVVAGIRDAIAAFVAKDADLARLRVGALTRARRYLWAAHAETMASAYHAAAAGRLTRPPGVHAEVLAEWSQ